MGAAAKPGHYPPACSRRLDRCVRKAAASRWPYPVHPDGSRYWRGIQQFVVGTGGTALRPFADIKPNSKSRQSSAHGVLKLELREGDYSWHFISVDGSFTDSGTRRCRGRN